jgi:hypothetical protein
MADTNTLPAAPTLAVSIADLGNDGASTVTIYLDRKEDLFMALKPAAGPEAHVYLDKFEVRRLVRALTMMSEEAYPDRSARTISDEIRM